MEGSRSAPDSLDHMRAALLGTPAHDEYTPNAARPVWGAANVSPPMLKEPLAPNNSVEVSKLGTAHGNGNATVRGATALHVATLPCLGPEQAARNPRQPQHLELATQKAALRPLASMRAKLFRSGPPITMGLRVAARLGVTAVSATACTHRGTQPGDGAHTL